MAPSAEFTWEARSMESGAMRVWVYAWGLGEQPEALLTFKLEARFPGLVGQGFRLKV